MFAGRTLAAPKTELPVTFQKKSSRRAWLRQAGAVAGVLPLESLASHFGQSPASAAPQASLPVQGKPASLPATDPTKHKFSPAEDAFLEEVERASFRFFLAESYTYNRQGK
jgi:hypothetical protein